MEQKTILDQNTSTNLNLFAIKNYLRSLKSVAVAFSNGVDSSFLLHIAHEVLGDNCIAITVSSCFTPKKEIQNAVAFCRAEKIRHTVITVDPLNFCGVAENPKNRCYLCKKTLFYKILETATTQNAVTVLDGSNKDDESDFRPGRVALSELGIISPLSKFGFTKQMIRECARHAGLENWNKPAAACLASRFPYGELLTKEKLHRVELAENFLYEKGFFTLRVRSHENIARIEIPTCDMEKLLAIKDEVSVKLKALGYSFVSMDLSGFKSGSMNI